jgi:hypothetical protein
MSLDGRLAVARNAQMVCLQAHAAQPRQQRGRQRIIIARSADPPPAATISSPVASTATRGSRATGR